MVKNLPANAGDMRYVSLIPRVGKILWRRKWQSTPVFLPGKSHGQRSRGLQSTGSQRVRQNWSNLVGSTSLLDESVLSQFYIVFCITESKEMNRLFREVEKSLPCSTDTSNSKYFNECVFCISLLCNYPMSNKFPFCDLFFICIILRVLDQF